jgi:NDP-sugar pyrophosphorylase family protein
MQPLAIESFFSLEGVPFAELFQNCFYVWEPLGKLNEFLLGSRLGKIEVELPSSVHLVNPEAIRIGKGTRVEPGAYIRGPCIIGENCEIRHGAYIRGHVITGNGCVIGHDTEIKRSILLNHVCAGHFNYVGDSILGNGVNLGAGVKCANLRLDHEDIQIVFQGEKISTGLKKLGAIIGDETQLGCNCVTNPGVLMGKKAFCHPCINVNGYIPSYARVKSTQKIVIVEQIHVS